MNLSNSLQQNEAGSTRGRRIRFLQTKAEEKSVADAHGFCRHCWLSFARYSFATTGAIPLSAPILARLRQIRPASSHAFPESETNCFFSHAAVTRYLLCDIIARTGFFCPRELRRSAGACLTGQEDLPDVM
ncbi:hypothetical protein [Herbaspirillum sp. RV1423]|uniref:hypothetical protein n=1 Tax=Herbaspirillum sp. RV1423 TaxID=1443993 RepID=UPI0012DF6F38|nr:hypothetical protein [Herbaspirillum sp. RV1423]